MEMEGKERKFADLTFVIVPTSPTSYIHAYSHTTCEMKAEKALTLRVKIETAHFVSSDEVKLMRT